MVAHPRALTARPLARHMFTTMHTHTHKHTARTACAQHTAHRTQHTESTEHRTHTAHIMSTAHSRAQCTHTQALDGYGPTAEPEYALHATHQQKVRSGVRSGLWLLDRCWQQLLALVSLARGRLYLEQYIMCGCSAGAASRRPPRSLHSDSGRARSAAACHKYCNCTTSTYCYIDATIDDSSRLAAGASAETETTRA